MIHHTLHRIFLIGMFIMCAVSVVLFLRGKVIAADLSGTNLNNISKDTATNIKNTAANTATNIEDAAANTATNIKDTAANTATNIEDAAANTATNIEDTAANTTNNASETTTDSQTTLDKVDGVCGYPSGVLIPGTIYPRDCCSKGTVYGFKITKTGWEWYCVGINGGDKVFCSAKNAKTDPPTNTSTTTPTIAAPINSVETNQQGTVSDNIPEVKINQSVVVLAQNLVADNNPKISGQVDKALSIDAVNFSVETGTGKKIKFSGKAQPNVLLTIYIFSNDPIVITVKTDENGNWSYELDKELADGQHEAYVAITENSGKILAKSEPIAFVKTAQAVNMIPVSDLKSSQSPIARSQQQYVLMAIVIMFICLGISLVLIGIVTHKRQINERID